ncbi:MAG TPA: ABC transporter permease, partial [Bryobacteraceae bacterium]|nr:ABC transporter permease [Bryobacteraceae bacterium]
MNGLVQDLRQAARAFANNPGFTLAALLSLAIGIGANTSIFSVANALLLRPLPYRDADRLAILWNRSPGLNITEDWFSTAQYFDIKNSQSGFEQLAIAIGGNYNLTGDGEPERVGTIRVSANLLPMLGASPALGRLFVAEEDAPGRPATAVLSYGTWQRRYGRDPKVLGRSITLNGQTYQIAGVLSERFSLPREVLPTLGGAEQAEILVSLPLASNAATIRTREDYNIMGKLKPGVTVQQAQVEMNALTGRLMRDFPEAYPPNSGLTFSIVPLQEQVVGNVRRTLLVLIASVGFVLLIACANVANLLLSRAVSREREIAVRTALGAGRGRLIRQLLTESLLLAFGGGVTGMLLAMGSLAALRSLGSKSVPRLAEVSIDARVLLFTLVLCALAGVLFGLAPALRASRLDLHTSLKDAARGSGGSTVWGRSNNLRRLLVAAELALSLVLLIGAGLLIRSFAHLINVPTGFNSRNVLTLSLTMNGRKYDKAPAVIDTYRQLADRLEQLPGVIAAGAVSSIPLSQMFAWGPITIEGRVPAAGEKFINCDERVVNGRYFQAMQIPLLQGRFFTGQDNLTSPRVIIVDEFMAREFWPAGDAIGKRVKLGGLTANAPWQTIVGVVGRVKQDSLDSDPRIALYMPQGQSPARGMIVTVRAASDAGALAAAVKKEIRDLDPDLPIYNLRTMTERVDEFLAPRRFSTLLLGTFAFVALALAAIGTYGVIAYLVTQSTREIGIRIALGATHRSILSLVVGRAMVVVLVGVAVGLAGAFALTRFLRGLLFGVNPTDPLTFFGVAILLALV